MKVILDYWNRHWQSVAFDCTLGKANVRWLAGKPRRSAGWAMHHSGNWYAVRLEGQDLVFQAGPNQWTMDGDFQCRNDRRGAIRVFTIHRGDAITLQIKYDSMPELDEPTADNLDLETRDFFYWVARIWNDPGLKASLKANWKQAESTV